MTPLVADRPSLFDTPAAVDQRAGRRALDARSAERALDSTRMTAASVGDRATLETAVSGVWEVLVAHRVAACLVCGGSLTPRYGASGKAAGGRCTDCGATLG